ncbi:hypothetical protein [Psychrobacillus sp. MER TA 171]|uniref:hypothetical protein n=1 Tax=Psychrobacillus sp. MER TA 171 TaxID=2939577 RepID=UPI00203BBCBD|nr:hypothetical protein [Psychrobacillus sp. MER TA 171]MCM3359775.1 hypothetical protein [Psychrobacillus sp. MER TA 171]
MGWIVLLFIGFIWIILFQRNKTSYKFGITPKTLELKQIKGLKKLNDTLEQTLNSSFMENVEVRVRKNNRLKENEYEWRLLDLKRYFIMTALLRESPMFSEKVDELWHEMLMFTREYDNFSVNYLGAKLHHSPNIKIEPNPNLRGFFDWVYAELFFIRRENSHLYKGFFKNPVHPSVMEDFKNLSENELIDIYFKRDSKYMKTVLALITSMKNTVHGVRDYEKKIIHKKLKQGKAHQNFNAMLLPFLSVSYFHYNDFSSYMKISNSDNLSNNTSCGSASSCSSCSSDSSCSSCGGGD